MAPEQSAGAKRLSLIHGALGMRVSRSYVIKMDICGFFHKLLSDLIDKQTSY
jgi:hypothetical protein